MSDYSKVVIAIDGPAGAGKSTVAKALAQKLGLRYLDTGAMYRALAYKAQELSISPFEHGRLADLAAAINIDFGAADASGAQTVRVDGEDVTGAIRTPEIGQMASEISTQSAVRVALVEKQKAIVAQGGVTLEGRDVTTVVAPNATVKVYLTASLEERAGRRMKEFQTKGMDASFDRVRTDIQHRDHRDITREDSPLSVAPGATIIDSAHRTPDQVVSEIVALVERALES